MTSFVGFCILTPQSKAVNCDKAIKRLRNSGLLFKGNSHSVRSKLNGVRFPNNKARYLVAARKFLKNKGNSNINSVLNRNETFKTREWLVKNIKGLG